MLSEFPTCQQARLQTSWCTGEEDGVYTQSHSTEQWFITASGNVLMLGMMVLVLLLFLFLMLWSGMALRKAWHIHGNGWQPVWMRLFHLTQFTLALSQAVAMAVSCALCGEIFALVKCCGGFSLECVPLLPVRYFTSMFVALMLSWGFFFAAWSLTMSYWTQTVKGYSRRRTNVLIGVVSSHHTSSSPSFRSSPLLFVNLRSHFFLTLETRTSCTFSASASFALPSSISGPAPLLPLLTSVWDGLNVIMMEM
jgi:hypothetical protein